MKILLLSDANSSHTMKWAFSLQNHGVNILLFSLFKPNQDVAQQYQDCGITIVDANLQDRINHLRRPNLSKLNYIKSLRLLTKTIDAYQPNLLHAHYASSYGVLGYLSKFKPWILSVWGSDIYDFPQKNRWNKWLLNKVLNNAETVCSTSQTMANEVSQYFDRSNLEVVPFGIDPDIFTPTKEKNQPFTVGTIKSIEKHNNMDCFLDAVKIVIYDYKLSNLQFLIVGEGSQLEKMKQKAKALNIDTIVTFSGFIPHKSIVEYYQKLSIFISVSTRESFGVSVLEAAACGIPAITSDVGGLPEVNQHNHTGWVMPPSNPRALADAIKKLYQDNQLRTQFGKNARQRVIQKFNWKTNVQKMINIYSKVVNHQ
ncbi:MAG: glycosyltransferase [Candidatus Marinimicrobia bacterium]|nr:glycosyltransferase [Candidatus Neomarinimicrobiota bacterium]